MMKLDNDPNIIEWSSEEIAVPYQSPLDNNIHRYFPDFRVKDNTGHTYLVEIKPAKETVQPVHKSTMRRFLKESATFAINLKKWEAARRYCEQRGWSFKILTEIELGIPQRG